MYPYKSTLVGYHLIDLDARAGFNVVRSKARDYLLSATSFEGADGDGEAEALRGGSQTAHVVLQASMLFTQDICDD